MNTNKTSLITIGIPLYNMENSICNAIDSCLNQTYKNFEILIVDDKSTDNGVKVVEDKYKKEIKNGKIRIYKREKNGGVSYAMYDMVEQAKGEYIAILDADDTNYPERIEKQYYAIKEAEETHPNQMVACFCGSYVNNLTTHSHFTIDPNDLFDLNFCGGTGHSMYKVADLIKIGNFDRDIRSTDSIMCWKMLLNNCHYVMLSEPLIVYNYILTQNKNVDGKQDNKKFIQLQKKFQQQINIINRNIKSSNTTGNIYLDRFFRVKYKSLSYNLLTVPIITKYSIRGIKKNIKDTYYLFNFLPLLTIRVRIRPMKNKTTIQCRLFGFIPVYTKISYGIEQ